MSLALSRTPHTPEPVFDLDYSVNDVEIDPGLDTRYLIQRVEASMLREGFAGGGRTLDVACGVGVLAAGIAELGGEAWGLDASPEMIGLARWIFGNRAVFIRGIAEVLPFRDGAFDRVICQGSLDHFVDPQAFMREAARILRPDGRLVLALANYESLSCLIGRLRLRLSRDLLAHEPSPQRLYWQIPPDHYHKGELPFVLGLGGEAFRLRRCYGISLLWLVKGWAQRLDEMPRSLADATLRALDALAYPAPELADMIISVWQPRKE